MPARKSSAGGRKPAAPIEDAHKGLLGSGLQALKDVRQDMRARRGRVFEALMGHDTAAPPAGEASPEAVFEGVFDE